MPAQEATGSCGSLEALNQMSATFRHRPLNRNDNAPHISAFGGEADMPFCAAHVR